MYLFRYGIEIQKRPRYISEAFLCISNCEIRNIIIQVGFKTNDYIKLKEIKLYLIFTQPKKNL